MQFKSPLILTCYFLFSIPSAYADHKALVIYDESHHKSERVEEKEIKDSGIAEAVVAFINEKFILSQSLKFIFGGDDGPLFDSQSNKVHIPYSFLHEVKNRFKRSKYAQSGGSVLDVSLDSVMHTLFHELAHALIYMHDIPVIGKEEDAADGLATILLIEFFDDGAEIAISAADLFDLESEDIVEFEEADFWDDHSLDLQRFYSTLCYVYGSNPKKYTSSITDIGFPEERADNCIIEYENALKSWLMLLKPYMKGKQVFLNQAYLPKHSINKAQISL